MSATVGDLKHAAQAQFVRAQKAEQKAEDIQHALNLVLNFGFERFHMALSADGAVHFFELGIVRNLPVRQGMELPLVPRCARSRRIVLWKTTFPQGHLYASAFHEPEFQSLPKHSEQGSGLRNLLEEAIEKIPTAMPFLIKGDSAQNR
jgi:hypothetical protein